MSDGRVGGIGAAVAYPSLKFKLTCGSHLPGSIRISLKKIGSQIARCIPAMIAALGLRINFVTTRVGLLLCKARVVSRMFTMSA